VLQGGIARVVTVFDRVRGTGFGYCEDFAGPDREWNSIRCASLIGQLAALSACSLESLNTHSIILREVYSRSVASPSHSARALWRCARDSACVNKSCLISFFVKKKTP
jgi:hypothetical protein